MIDIIDNKKRNTGKDRTVKCPKCLDHGYITLLKYKNKIPYEYFFACSCELGKTKVENTTGKTFKNGEAVKTHTRDYRCALHQGYKFTENSDHIPAYDNFRNPSQPVQRGAYID